MGIKWRVCFSACFLLSIVAARPSRSEDPVKVGVILPLIGAWAEFGEAVRNGTLLAQEELKDRFGGVQFIFEDDHYDPKTALTAWKKLIHINGVAVVHVWGNESALALAEIAEHQQRLLLATSQNAAVSRGKKYVIRLLNPMADFDTHKGPRLKHPRNCFTVAVRQLIS